MNIVDDYTHKFSREHRQKIANISKKYDLKAKKQIKKTNEKYGYSCPHSVIELSFLFKIRDAIKHSKETTLLSLYKKRMAYIKECIDACIYDKTMTPLMTRDKGYSEASMQLGLSPSFFSMTKKVYPEKYRFMRMFGKGNWVLGYQSWNNYCGQTEQKLFNLIEDEFDGCTYSLARKLYDNNIDIGVAKSKNKDHRYVVYRGFIERKLYNREYSIAVVRQTKRLTRKIKELQNGN